MSQHNFAAYLREIRKGKNLTMVELSKAAGVSQSYLSQLENGKSLPTDAVVNKLLIGLTTSVEEQNEIKVEMNNRILLDESSKALDELGAKDSKFTDGDTLLSNLVKQANAITEWNFKIDRANKTVNLNNILDYFDKKEEVRITNEKRMAGKFVSPDDDIRGIEIHLDGSSLSDEEVKALEYLVLGLQKRRNEK